MDFVTGNLLDSEAEALVNTVNTVGVMGKGIALQFKERFPENFLAYKRACKEAKVEVGKMFVHKELTLHGEKTIINFPTKKHWRHKSQYSYIEEGLKDFVKVLRERNIRSVAIPPLGAGNGGLDWTKVKELLVKHLSDIPNTEILVYEPNAAIKQVLQKESRKKDVKLTPARAMLLHSLYRYEKFGEASSVFVANKIMYFLQQTGENLRLNFIPYAYGPYDQAVEKVLYALNGKYLKGLEQMQTEPFEPLELNYSKESEVAEYIDKELSAEQKQRLHTLFRIMEGFESAFSLEILSSVHFANKQLGVSEPVRTLKFIHDWNDRKKYQINERHVNIAMEHLAEYGTNL
ncbi:MAG: macro domain-containing protein [Cyclobacteriaceae bacterium]